MITSEPTTENVLKTIMCLQAMGEDLEERDADSGEAVEVLNMTCALLARLAGKSGLELTLDITDDIKQ